MGSNRPNANEEFEVLDVTGTARNIVSWFPQMLNDVKKAPVAKQAAVGGLSGWVVGYISMKVGKMAATAVGSTLILMQLAAHKGYIKVDWSRVNKDLEKSAKKISKEVQPHLRPGSSEAVVRFAHENAVLASSFAGGILLGIACS